MSEYVHGIIATVTGIGEITSFSEESSGTQITAVGHLGHTVAEAFIDPKLTYNIEALFTGSEPAAGTTASISGHTCRILTVKITEEGVGYKKVSMTANHFVTNSLPAGS